MAKTRKSSFATQLDQAHEQHKGNETRVGGGGSLPPGIENGIAKITDAKIGVYAKGDYEGEPFFMAAGAVLEPESVTITNAAGKPQVVPVRGQRTQIGPIPICDTVNAQGKETPLADHWDRILNHLRLLGINTKESTPDQIVAEPQEGQFETGPVLEALAESGVTFGFRTWCGAKLEQTSDGKWRVGKKTYKTKEAALKANPYSENPRVNEDWRQACEYDADMTAGTVEDNTEAAPWESEEPAEVATSEEPVVAEVESPQDPDYEALAKIADDNPKSKAGVEAASSLAEQAKVLGITGYEDMLSWADVASAIIKVNQVQPDPEASTEEFEEFEEEGFVEEAWKPVKDEFGIFNHPKSGAVKCQFIEVYEDEEKVDLKRLDTNRMTKKVPFKFLAAG